MRHPRSILSKMDRPFAPWVVVFAMTGLASLVCWMLATMVKIERDTAIQLAGETAQSRASQTANALGLAVLVADGVALQTVQSYLGAHQSLLETDQTEPGESPGEDSEQMLSSQVAEHSHPLVSSMTVTLLNSIKELKSSAVFDATGQVIAATAYFPTHAFSDSDLQQDLEVLQEAWNEPHIRLVHDPVSGDTDFFVARGIWDARGGFGGMAVVVADLDWIKRVVLQDILRGAAHLSVFLPNGTVLFDEHGSETDMWGPISWLTPAELIGLRAGALIEPQGETNQGHPGTANSEEHFVRGNLVRFAVSPTFPVSVFYQRPEGVILQQWHGYAQRMAFAAGALIIIVIAGSVLYWRQEAARRAAVRYLQDQEQRLSYALDASGEALWDWNRPTGEVFYSPQIMRMTNEEVGSWDPTPEAWRSRVHPDDFDDALAQFMTALSPSGSDSLDIEFRLRKSDGTWLWVRSRGQVFERNDAGEAIRILGTYQDISRERGRVEALEYQGLHDALTGIGNRLAFDRAVKRLTARMVRKPGPAAVILFDLDFFKSVNDTHGHAAGDAVLQETARRITQALRQEEEELFFRIGGEEFIVLLPDATEGQARRLATRMRVAVAETPMTVSEMQSIAVTISLGVAAVEQDEDMAVAWQAAIGAADAALYAAKNNGRNRVIGASDVLPSHNANALNPSSDPSELDRSTPPRAAAR